MTGDKTWANSVHSILDCPLSTRRPIGPRFIDHWLADQILACTRRDFPIRASDAPRTMKLTYYRKPGSVSLAITFANWTAIPGRRPTRCTTSNPLQG